ncbi:hypothetical protein PROFUN_02603 [Planoprotostelium fungivorum]|uniref:Uncharacterized protein n=1 Tax=Planoprotostelium fungivorum TaxID=1890364 RepID=A0A2P6MPH3_9EUKA|nr:hypothetical protein PROFUN_02603 [Planoprotostelium fungivorum]
MGTIIIYEVIQDTSHKRYFSAPKKEKILEETECDEDAFDYWHREVVFVGVFLMRSCCEFWVRSRAAPVAELFAHSALSGRVTPVIGPWAVHFFLPQKRQRKKKYRRKRAEQKKERKDIETILDRRSENPFAFCFLTHNIGEELFFDQSNFEHTFKMSYHIRSPVDQSCCTRPSLPLSILETPHSRWSFCSAVALWIRGFQGWEICTIV